jgi:hypothetical protein
VVANGFQLTIQLNKRFRKLVKLTVMVGSMLVGLKSVEPEGACWLCELRAPIARFRDWPAEKPVARTVWRCAQTERKLAPLSGRPQVQSGSIGEGPL